MSKKGQGIGCTHHNYKGGPLLVKCEICSKEFHARKDKVKKGEARFCSVSCVNKWKENFRVGKNSPGYGNYRSSILRTCTECSKSFRVENNVLKSGGGKFCSFKCRVKWQSENMKGDKSPRWKGGITPVIVKIRTSVKYQEWRQSVLIRDNFTCQNCKKVGGKLQAHHKKRFSVLIEETKHNLPLLGLYEAAMSYTPLWDISNGETLCTTCHPLKGTIKERKQ